VSIVTSIGDGDIAAIPPRPLASFVAPDQDYRTSIWVENKEQSKLGFATRTGTKLLHIVMSRTLDRVDKRPAQPWTFPSQDAQGREDLIVGILVK